MEKTFQHLGKAPEEFAKFVPPTPPTASQLRARALSNTARLADSATIQAIGRAAMASRNPAGPAEYRVALERFLGMTDWPSEKLYTTAIDCFTGERIILSQADGLPINDGCAASSSLPGSQGPTWLKDRLCMDGGISESSIGQHSARNNMAINSPNLSHQALHMIAERLKRSHELAHAAECCSATGNQDGAYRMLMDVEQDLFEASIRLTDRFRCPLRSGE